MTTATALDVKLTASFGEWTRLNRLLAPFVSQDEARPVLCCAHITNVDGLLRFEATDSYKLIRFGTDIPHQGALDTLIDWPFIQRAMRLLRYRKNEIVFTMDEKRAMLSDSVDSVSTVTPFASLGTIPFPKLDPYCLTEAQPLEATGFNPDSLAQLCAAIHREPPHAVRIVQMLPMKPLIVEMPGTAASWPGHAALMPVRIP